MDQTWLNQLPLPEPLTSWQPVSGGDINLAFRLQTATKNYFMKVQPQQPASYFAHEINGLKQLGQAVNVPHPLFNGQIKGDAFLILNWLDEGRGAQADLGQAVARLHQVHHDQFGFFENHHTKALVKDNSFTPSWADFYLHQRLEPEVATAVAAGRWNDWRNAHFKRMAAQFVTDCQQRTITPSLLHGDLWAGNFMFTADGTPTLIDPDAVFGDREFDLAMTTIFGGFRQAFYQAYQAAYPLDAGWQTRLPYYQFYYLCMHLILFGEGYGPAVDRILEQY
ncbi:Aminoglycoside phosphotransferase [Limosilactobacillus fermentum F-6]|uniref:fructosamine kinase family protein n=1 Tax=Limosilactobacillus fermentum TaxID=1613 RepID=UPI00032AB4FA|nr:fructosamine kinase family protein [Limosilactobacillus fermentum]AGL88766.1 Aminoglycoside phosphotransferase [Limosilactobacillus fermentum F-6]